MHIIDRLELFHFGWKHKMAWHLDMAGCPVWLVKWRCPSTKGWGTLIYELCKLIDPMGEE